MLTLSDIFTKNVIKVTLSVTALAIVLGGVQQAALSFQHFAQVDNARQTTFVELASQTK